MRLTSAPRRALLAALLAAPLLAHAQDRWSDPLPGVRHLDRRLPDPNRVNALFIDLCQPGISLHATRPDDRGQVTSRFARDYGLVAAINGGFYNVNTYGTIGLTVGEGERWADGADNDITGFIAFGEDNRATISIPSAIVAAPERWMRAVIPGMPLLLRDGQVVQEPCTSHYCERHPRTVVGLDASGRTLILVTVDGRWSGISRGMNRDELAALMLDLGARTALNLDGGGSTTMVLNGAVMNHPSDGSERRVSNHLGVALNLDARLSHCCTPSAAPQPGPRFIDVPSGHWAEAAAEALYQEGITQGCQQSPLAFCPDCGVTRAAAALFLARALGLPDGGVGRFEDVGPETMGAEAIGALAAAGLSNGCSQDPPRFCPLSLLSRAEAVTLIVRAAGFDLIAPTGQFSDVGQAEWYAPYVETALDACLVSGCGDGRFCPHDHITRAELAVVLSRALELGGLRHCLDGEREDAGVEPPPVDASVAPIQDILWPDAAPRDAGVEPDRRPLDPPWDAAWPVDAALDSGGGPLAPDGGRFDAEITPDAARPRPDAARPQADAGASGLDGGISRVDMGRVGGDVGALGAEDREAAVGEGCHCRQGARGGAWLWLLAPLWLLRRRRGSSPT
ncbi:phosphodiester glycosidase family protein [Myxococcota bacterium]|nr:phosphodiester glycosidase family protein [Myxococcota bacterium]